MTKRKRRDVTVERTAGETPLPNGDGPSQGSITVRGGVNPQGEPFCQLTWDDKNGQLPPGALRQLALHCLEAAAAAEMDASLYGFFTEQMGLPVEAAGQAIMAVREIGMREHPEPPPGAVLPEA